MKREKIMKRTEYFRNSRHSTSIMSLLAVFTLILLGGVKLAQAQSQWNSSGNDISSANSGNVGVGTTTPGTINGVAPSTTDRHVHVNSASGYASFIVSGASGASLNMWNGGGGTDQKFFQLTTFSGKGYLRGINDAINNITYNFLTTDLSNGNVGIGITSPAQRLDVGGSLAINGATVINNNRVFSARATFNTNTADGVWSTDAAPSTIFTPSSYLNTGFIFGYDGNSQYTPSLGISVPNNGTGDERVIQLRRFGGSSFEAKNRFEVSAVGKLSWGDGANPTDVSIYRSGNNSLTLNAGTNGTVGITGGATISGTLTATGGITGTTINATYQDVAEWVPATHTLAAGTVVVLNPTKSNEVMASRKAYDTGVAGVVSPHPGLTLGEAGKDKALVATTGRVKVKVDATRAPIHVGDLLVTSDEEGVAMKSVPLSLGGTEIHRPGTLIGKALEPLESGKGEILVLLSLQ
jgi:hypothetical protein